MFILLRSPKQLLKRRHPGVAKQNPLFEKKTKNENLDLTAEVGVILKNKKIEKSKNRKIGASKLNTVSCFPAHRSRPPPS